MESEVHMQKRDPDATAEVKRRQVKGRALVVVLLLSLLLAAVVVGLRDRAQEATVGAECPAELGDCSGVDTTLPGVTTSVPGTVTTTSLPAGELLTAQSDTLRLEVRIDPTQLVTAQALRVNVRAVDKPRAAIVGSHDFGDGYGGGRPDAPFIECVQTLPTTTAPEPETEKTWTFDYSYRQPGRYTLLVEVVSTSCRDEDHHRERRDVDGDGLISDEEERGRRAVITTVLNVGEGLLLANGPIQPVVALDRVPSHDDPDRVMLNVGGKDIDGWMKMLVLDWGDGSEPFVIERASSKCIDPLKRWPGPSEILELASHRYPTSGTYTATLTVTSAACDGSGEQPVSTTLSVDAP